MKTVFSSHSELCHVFANLRDGERFERSGRAGNMLFSNGTLYSYGHHFAIARYTLNPSGEVAILFTDRDYSSSTSKHKSYARRALHGRVLTVPTLEGGNYAQKWSDQFKEVFGKFTRARQNKPHYLRTLRVIASNARDYYAFCGEDMPGELSDVIAILDTDETIANSAEVFAQIAAKAAERESARDAEKVAKWKTGETNSCSTSDGISYLRYNPVSERVETSQQVKIGVLAARELWRQIKCALISGDASNLLGARVLDAYTVRGLNSKHITIGCHKIPVSETDAIATLLAWTMPDDMVQAARDKRGEIDKLIGDKREFTITAKDGSTRVPCEGYAVEIEGFPGLFVHHHYDGEGFDANLWDVSELQTGFRVTCRENTGGTALTSRRLAVSAARDILQKHGSEAFTALVQRQLAHGERIAA